MKVDSPSLGAAFAAGRQIVVAPEQVALDVPVAGPTLRMIAYGIDCLAILAIELAAVIGLLLLTPLAERLLGPARELVEELGGGGVGQVPEAGLVLGILGVALLLQFTIEAGYFIASELITGGRSLGKLAVGLRVMRDGGLPLTPEATLVRNLLRAVDLLPGTYVVGLVAIVLSSQGKRLGDQAAGTVVVRLDRPPPAPEIEMVAASTTVFRLDHAHVAALGTAERALIRQTLRRLETVPPERAAALLETSVEALRQRLGYGPVAPAERRAFLEALFTAIEGQ
ncbi:RDD family protein [Candidatus Binatia bacterium]|nr:RDD family protein [Candidatus Binatia bacterium]